MQNYLNLLKDILENGTLRDKERTGNGTLGVFGRQLRWDLSEGFPLITTKRMFFRGILEELLFFLRGDTNTKLLEEKGVKIWTGNTSREFLDAKGLKNYPEGEAGPVYGFQWRNWGGLHKPVVFDDGSHEIVRHSSYDEEGNRKGHYFDGVDQIALLVDTIRNNPHDRRMIVSAWNVGELDTMCLPPCHYAFQCYVNDGKLSLMWNQRSCDFFLGIPFNIASYACLVHILAKLTNLEPGELIFVGGDCHIYLNHMDQVTTQLGREPFPLPQLKINKDLRTLKDVEALEFSDFELVGYQYHPPIKAPMAI